MKVLVGSLCILIVASLSFQAQNKKLMSKISLEQSEDKSDNVDLDSDDVPSIESPSSNEEEYLSNDDSFYMQFIQKNEAEHDYDTSNFQDSSSQSDSLSRETSVEDQDGENTQESQNSGGISLLRLK